MITITLENLFLLCDALEIVIRYRDLHAKRPLLEGYACLDRRQIILDESLKNNRRQHKCVLAEEIGHFLYPPTGNHYVYHLAEYRQAVSVEERSLIFAAVIKDERLALRWATDFLIPDVAFWDFTKTGPHEIWEWCEHFDVESWFMHLKIGYIRRKSREKRGVKHKSKSFYKISSRPSGRNIP